MKRVISGVSGFCCVDSGLCEGQLVRWSLNDWSLVDTLKESLFSMKILVESMMDYWWVNS